MKKKLVRILLGIMAGMVIFPAALWLLGQCLGNVPTSARYAGNPMEYWQQQLYGGDLNASNHAAAVLNGRIIPQLVDIMLHDTNDSPARVALINWLNDLPGLRVSYDDAATRRIGAAHTLGEFGPAARSALRDLLKELAVNENAMRAAVIYSCGEIRSEPDTVIPLLIPYLEDDELDITAAGALAKFGRLARPAVPKLLPLLHAADADDRAAARDAWLKIDPEAAAQAGIHASPTPASSASQPK